MSIRDISADLVQAVEQAGAQRQPLVIDAELMHQGGVEVVNGHAVAHYGIAELVGFTVHRAALRVGEYHVFTTDILQHRSRNLAGVCADVLVTHVLCRQLDRRPGNLGGHGWQVDKRRANDNFC